MDVFDAINRRQGVLHYKETPVEPETIDAVLAAAITAPSPLNLQPWAFLVVTDRALTVRVADYLVRVQAELLYGGLLGMSEDFVGRMLGLYTELDRVPCFILACLQPKAGFVAPPDRPIVRDWYLMSIGAAMQNLMVAATALGLGTRWFTGFTFDEEGMALKKLFRIPPEVEVVGVTPLGYHDEPLKERPEQTMAALIEFRQGNGPALARLFRGKLPPEEVVHRDGW